MTFFVTAPMTTRTIFTPRVLPGAILHEQDGARETEGVVLLAVRRYVRIGEGGVDGEVCQIAPVLLSYRCCGSHSPRCFKRCRYPHFGLPQARFDGPPRKKLLRGTALRRWKVRTTLVSLSNR